MSVAIVVGLVLAYFAATSFSSYYVARGAALFNEGNFKEAEANLNKAIFFNPLNPVPHAYLGRMFMPDKPERKGDYPMPSYENAAKHFEKATALGISKDNFSFYTIMLHDFATSYRNLGRYDEANKIYLEKIRLSPTSSFWARYWLASDYYERSNKPKEALDILLPALESTDVDPNNTYKVYLLLSSLYNYFGDYQNSKKYAQLTIENAKTDFSDFKDKVIGAHLLLSTIAKEENNFSLAIQEIEKAGVLAGSLSAFNCDLARVYLKQKDFKKALTLANSAEPTNSFGRARCVAVLARIHLAQGNASEAKKHLGEYLSLTDNYEKKNIFIWRTRDEFQKELDKLK